MKHNVVRYNTGEKSVEYGINHGSMRESQYFDATSALLPDVMHDIRVFSSMR